jgi:hypothetical protein
VTRQTNPHQHEIGYVTSRTNQLTNDYCILYDGDKAGEVGSGRWTILCSFHGSVVTNTNKRAAISLLRTPSSWCEACRTLAEMDEAEYILTLRTDRTTDEQLKRLASLAIGDPEKSQLFERLTGQQPEHYLSNE